jgi:hypothetical protein
MNIFNIKKIIALTVPGLITTLSFFIVFQFYGLLWACGAMILGVIVSFFLSSALIKNPFLDMLEGRGLLVLSEDSTGIIQPFIVRVNPPNAEGNIKGEMVKDAWDRNATFTLSSPVAVQNGASFDEKGNMSIQIDNKYFNRARFGLYQYPVLIYNNMLKSFVTKDYLSATEKNMLSEHFILNANRQMEQLSGYMRDFGRGIVELHKPKDKSLLSGKMVWIIVIVLIIIIGILFAKPIYQSFINFGGGAVESAKIATQNSNIITPR